MFNQHEFIAKQQTYNLQTNQFLFQIYVVSSEIIWLRFQRHFQVWNVKKGTRLFKGKDDPKTILYDALDFINETTIVVLYIIDSELHMIKYNIETNQISILTKYQNQSWNRIAVFYFRNVNKIMSCIGKQNNLRFYQLVINQNQSKLILQNYESINIPKKYDQKGTLVCFNHGTYSKCFTMIQENDIKQFQLILQISKGIIIQIKRDSENKAVVAIVDMIYSQYQINQNPTTIVLFNLSTKCNLKLVKLQFFLDKILLVNNVWIGIAIDNDQLLFKAQICFDDPYNFIQQVQIFQGLRCFHDFIPILYVNTSPKNQIGESNLQVFTRIQFNKLNIDKQPLYIHLLQKSGLLDEFGVQLLKQVINNLI